MKSIQPRVIFFIALSFLFLRNLPLCFLMPLWSHGDEIAHIDYILKLNQGHLPQPGDYIESNLFYLHKAHYDSHNISPQELKPVSRPEDLGLAQYSYEAHQPPLPYLILSLFRYLFLGLGASMLLQIKLLRVVTLFAAAGGLLFIYSGLKRTKVRNNLFYFPLLFIPLLNKDMFFSVNTDNFSFLFSSLALMGIILLLKDPFSQMNWVWFLLGTVTALWSKIPNGFLFLLWPLLIIFLWKKFKSKRSLRLSFAFFSCSLLLSLPWYLYNQVRFGDPFSSIAQLPFPDITTQAFSFPSLWFFITGFLITLFRGEFVWNGVHFKILSNLLGSIFLIILPIFSYCVGAFSIFLPSNKKDTNLHRFLSLSCLIVVTIFCLAYFVIGGMPFYHAKYAFGGLYLLLYLFGAGWNRIIPGNIYAGVIPSVLLLFYNFYYTSVLLMKVF